MTEPAGLEIGLGPAPLRSSAWGLLLDRLEHRLRLLEASARPGVDEPIDVGPAVTAADVPAETPTLEERMRLLALVAAHDHAVRRLESRRRSLRQAQHYRMGAA